MSKHDGGDAAELILAFGPIVFVAAMAVVALLDWLFELF